MYSFSCCHFFTFVLYDEPFIIPLWFHFLVCKIHHAAIFAHCIDRIRSTRTTKTTRTEPLKSFLVTNKKYMSRLKVCVYKIQAWKTKKKKDKTKFGLFSAAILFLRIFALSYSVIPFAPRSHYLVGWCYSVWFWSPSLVRNALYHPCFVSYSFSSSKWRDSYAHAPGLPVTRWTMTETSWPTLKLKKCEEETERKTERKKEIWRKKRETKNLDNNF